MSFLGSLKSGETVEIAARDFVQNLLEKSQTAQQLSLEIAADFITDCLSAIGISCNIIADQLEADEKIFAWPYQQLSVYTFHCNEDFKRIERFLVLICFMAADQFELQLRNINSEDEVETSIDYTMQLLAHWCCVYKQLERLDGMNKTKRFEEPLARINFHFLLGFHELRKSYRSTYALLDKICDRLYVAALPGLHYIRAHELVLEGLLKLFEGDFHLLHPHLRPKYNFYYEAFLVKYLPGTHAKIYRSLQNLLKNEKDYLNDLIALLIQQPMLEIYFTTLVKEKKTSQLNKMEALNFLKLLQGKLTSFDVFSTEFMESILALMMNRDESLSNKAAELYALMRRNCQSQENLLHAINFYIDYKLSLPELKYFIRQLSTHFDFLMDFDNYLRIICDARYTDAIRSNCAQMLIMAAKLKVEISVFSAKSEIGHLMLILPDNIAEIGCQNTILIILEAFRLYNVNEWTKECIENYVHHALGIFLHLEKNLEYLVLVEIFNIFHNCLLFNKEWQRLQSITDTTTLQFQRLKRQLKEIKQRKQTAESKTLLLEYYELLKRLNIMIKTKYELFDNITEILSTLEAQFLQKPFLQDLIKANKCFMDVYAFEIICSCILKLYQSEGRTERVRKHVTNLTKYIWPLLDKVEDLLKLPVVRIKTYFNILVMLVGSTLLKLDNSIYNKCVEILLALNFSRHSLNLKDGDESTQMKPNVCLEYKRLMLNQFTKLHKLPQIAIRTNVIWKVCINYSLNNHNFNNELKELLMTLAEHRLNIFKHVLAVTIYNLYRREPPLKYNQLVSILEKHKKLVDNLKCIESPSSMHVHVVLLILQMTGKILDAQPIGNHSNRLKALSNLDIFLRDVDFRRSDIGVTIYNEMDKLNGNHLNKKEREKWHNLKNKLKKLQNNSST
ncbi:sisters unbound isoform 1-T1 [Glossina fuscipes fuscipes]